MTASWARLGKSCVTASPQKTQLSQNWTRFWVNGQRVNSGELLGKNSRASCVPPAPIGPVRERAQRRRDHGVTAGRTVAFCGAICPE